MSIYDELQDVASEILEEFKQDSVQLIKITQTGGTLDAPGTPVETAYDLDAVVKGINSKYLQEGFILSTDLEVTSAVLSGITISKDDYIKINSIKHKIVEDLSVPAAGTKCVWKFVVRKGG